jgi:outer membrane protein OmpA-like peptidoglycan-associated protein
MSRGRTRSEDEAFWPAYTDILMVTVLCLVLVVALFVLRPPARKDELPEKMAERKSVFATAFHATFRNLEQAGRIHLWEPRGAERQVITFSSELLFKVNDDAITNPTGRAALMDVSRLLRRFMGPRRLFRQVQINGHTDEDPILGGRFASNWHLSSARATAVLFNLVSLKVPPTHLSATGFAEFRAIDPAGTAIRTKASKRRIEIELLYPADWVVQQPRWSSDFEVATPVAPLPRASARPRK